MTPPDISLALGAIQLRGVTVSPSFEARLREALAARFAGESLAGSSGSVRLPPLRLRVAAEASDDDIAEALAKAIHQACQTGLGREPDGVR